MITLSLVLAAATAPPAAALDRPFDFVVRTGSDLPADFLGLPTDRVVGFRWDESIPDWVQIPVQVDERDEVPFALVFEGFPANIPLSHTLTAYTDASTAVGPDSDPSFDGDDEVCFTTDHAGDRAPLGVAWPAGTLDAASGAGVDGIGATIAMIDPIGGSRGYVYLFGSDGSLSQSAGTDAVTYTFVRDCGSTDCAKLYDIVGDPADCDESTYNTGDGWNCEDSTVVTANYSVRFLDRWTKNRIKITAGGANGDNVLDRHKIGTEPDSCARTEDDFSWGPGGFFAHKDGPVRAIRSLLGAKSGRMTQREHYFYASREEVVTTVRVHPIPGGFYDIVELGRRAAGMVYENSVDMPAGGDLVNGAGPLDLVFSPFDWEFVEGPEGTLTSIYRIDEDYSTIEGILTLTGYYSDTTSPTPVPCAPGFGRTGDPYEYGASGIGIFGPPSPTNPNVLEIPNTDPRDSMVNLHGPAEDLRMVRSFFYEGPGGGAADAAARADEVDNPLIVVLVDLADA